MPEYSDDISKLPNDDVKLDEKQIQLCNLFLGSTNNEGGVSFWKIFVLLIIVLLCIAPISQLKNFNKNYLFAGKMLVVVVTFVLLFYVV